MYIGHLPAASNRARYILTFTVFDEDTGEVIDLTGCEFTLSIRDPGSTSELLTATNGDGIDILDADEGIFELTFTSTQMRTLYAKQYEVGCTISADDEDDDQFIIGTLSVLDGVVT